MAQQLRRAVLGHFQQDHSGEALRKFSASPYPSSGAWPDRSRIQVFELFAESNSHCRPQRTALMNHSSKTVSAVFNDCIQKSMGVASVPCSEQVGRASRHWIKSSSRVMLLMRCPEKLTTRFLQKFSASESRLNRSLKNIRIVRYSKPDNVSVRTIHGCLRYETSEIQNLIITVNDLDKHLCDWWELFFSSIRNGFLGDFALPAQSATPLNRPSGPWFHS